jgi:hypothetical protein
MGLLVDCTQLRKTSTLTDMAKNTSETEEQRLKNKIKTDGTTKRKM